MTFMIAQNPALVSCLVDIHVRRLAQRNAEPSVRAMNMAPLMKLTSTAQW